MAKGLDTIEGEGFIFNLLNYLWMRNPYTQEPMHLHLPPTIFIRNGQPKLWYQSIHGVLRKKDNRALQPQQIIEHFSKQEKREKPDQKTAICLFIKPVLADGECSGLRFEYLDREMLVKFFNENKENYNLEGYLQKCIRSKGQHNHVIRVCWSKNLFFAQICTNPNSQDDRRFDFYQKLLTFESNKSSESKSIKSKALLRRLETLCRNIHLHVYNVSNNQIDILDFEAYLRLSEVSGQERIYFLFCSKLHLNCPTQPGQSKKHGVSLVRTPQVDLNFDIPEYVNRDKLFRKEGLDLRKRVHCENCLKMVDGEEVFQLRYGKLIEAWHNSEIEQVAPTESDSPRLVTLVKNSKLPAYFKNKYPKLTLAEFNEHIKSQRYLQRCATVCEECFLYTLKLADYRDSLESLSKYTVNRAKVYGVPRHMPRAIIKSRGSNLPPTSQSESRPTRLIQPMTPDQAFENKYRGLRRRYRAELQRVDQFINSIGEEQLASQLTESSSRFVGLMKSFKSRPKIN